MTTSDGFGGGPELLVDNGQIVNFTPNNMLTNPEMGAKVRVHIVFVLDLDTETLTVDRFVIICVKQG